MKLVALSFQEKQILFYDARARSLSNPQPGGSFEIMRNLNLENNENWGASRVSSMLKVKHYYPTTAKHFKKETKLGASVVIIPTRREGLTLCFFWINWTQFLNMNFL